MLALKRLSGVVSDQMNAKIKADLLIILIYQKKKSQGANLGAF